MGEAAQPGQPAKAVQLPKRIARALVRHVSCTLASESAITERRCREQADKAQRAWDDIGEVVSGLVQALRDEADLLDRWARESREGGWSTHQVDPMRRRAAEIRDLLADLEKIS
jgi:hypothetical protein